MRLRLYLIVVIFSCAWLNACGSPEERATAHLEKGRELFEQEDYLTARIEALNAAQLEPRNVDVRFLLADIEEKDGNFGQVVGHLLVAIDSDPSNVKARTRLGTYFILARSADQAEEQVNEAMKLEPGNPEVRLLNARLLFLRGDRKEALEETEAALEIDPGYIDAIIFHSGINMSVGQIETALANIDENIAKAEGDDARQLRQFRVLLLRYADRLDEAATDLISLIEDYPDSRDYAVGLAQIYIAQGKIDAAEEILRGVVDQDPDNPELRIAFARFIGEQRGAEASAETLKIFIAEQPDSAVLNFALAQVYESTDRVDDAYDLYLKVESLAAGSEASFAAQNRRAVIKISQNELEEARKIVGRILSLQSENADALMIRAAFLFTDKEYESAIADLRTVLRENPQSERALFLLARSHARSGNTELARGVYRQVLEINPGNAEASNELANLLALRGDADLAEEVLRELLEINPDDSQSSSNLIQALLLQGDVEAAEIEARNLLEIEEKTGLAEFQLGRVLQARESTEEALAAYQQAREKNPTATEPLQGLAQILVTNGRANEAIAILQSQLEEYPDHSDAKLLLSSVYASQEQKETAEELLEEIIAENPQEVRAYAFLGALYPEDPATRIVAYERGYKANPANVSMGLVLGTQYELSGRYEDAISLYEGLMKVNPDNEVAINNLAALLLDRRTDQESLTRALELAKRFENSDSPALADTLGWAYYRNSEYRKAIPFLEDSVAGAKDIPLLRYHLGMAYFRNQNTIRAREELEKSIELAQGDFTGIEEARSTLDEIPDTFELDN